MVIAAPLLSRTTMNRAADAPRPAFTARQGQFLAWLLSGSGVMVALRDEGTNKGPEQSFSTPTCVVHELKEAKIERQFVLRDAAVRTQPGTQQRPEAFDGVDVDFAEAVTIVITRILTAGMTHRLVAIAPRRQTGVDVVFVGVDQRAGCDRIRDDRLDRHLPHVRQHLQNDLPATLDQPE